MIEYNRAQAFIRGRVALKFRGKSQLDRLQRRTGKDGEIQPENIWSSRQIDKELGKGHACLSLAISGR